MRKLGGVFLILAAAVFFLAWKAQANGQDLDVEQYIMLMFGLGAVGAGILWLTKPKKEEKKKAPKRRRYIEEEEEEAGGH